MSKFYIKKWSRTSFSNINENKAKEDTRILEYDF